MRKAVLTDASVKMNELWKYFECLYAKKDAIASSFETLRVSSETTALHRNVTYNFEGSKRLLQSHTWIVSVNTPKKNHKAIAHFQSWFFSSTNRENTSAAWKASTDVLTLTQCTLKIWFGLTQKYRYFANRLSYSWKPN